MRINVVSFSAICIAASALTATSVGQSAPATYGALIQQGNAQLKGGSVDSALGAGQSAVKTNPAGWEGYTLEGGALMRLKRYEEAADAFSKAIERAPEGKQPALRELRRQCLQTAASSAQIASTQPEVATTTQAEVVLWKSIETSTNVADFQSYLSQYPQGAFVALANRHLKEIKALPPNTFGFKNDCPKTFYFALMYQPIGSSEWRTEGWFTVAANNTMPDTGVKTDKTDAYYYVETDQSHYDFHKNADSLTGPVQAEPFNLSRSETTPGSRLVSFAKWHIKVSGGHVLTVTCPDSETSNLQAGD
jgi:tetratricopeptide (TPR) repeat protein